jgi:NAD(P)-dependent dehydrogenase (short-subunit alcohol dehydrogenase family)
LAAPFARNLFDLSGKMAVVTGGARGVGRLCAEGLLDHGASVVITSRDAEAGEAARRELAERGPCDLVTVDLAAPDGVAALAGELAGRLDSVHILVNNAGVTWGAPYAEYPASAWRRVLDLDVAVPFQLVQATTGLLAAGATAEDPARVVNMGSIDGEAVGTFDNFAYSAAKAGIHHLTRVLARRLGPLHITVNALAPGPVRTKMTAELLEGSEQRLVAATPLGRLVEADDITGALVFLAARSGSFVTGAVIPVDGGAAIATWGAYSA